jgi:hypothetical protein
VPTLPRKAPWWASINWSQPEPGQELGQTDTNECTLLVQGLGRSGLGLALLPAGRGSHSLGPSLGGGNVHHYDSLCLECGLVLWRLMRLGCSSCLLAGELVSALHYLLLDAGLPSIGLCSLPLLMSALLLEGEVGV